MTGRDSELDALERASPQAGILPWWFGDVLPGDEGLTWSHEERRIYSALWGMIFGAYFLFLFGGILLGKGVGTPYRFNAWIVCGSVPLALWAGRRLSFLLFPRLAQTADRNAAIRLAQKALWQDERDRSGGR